MALSVGDAYSATGAAWRDGPQRVYGRLAEVLVASSPVGLEGHRVADVGSGTGAASVAIARAGGRPIALDLAAGMLLVDRTDRPPAVVADARSLPLATGSCRAVVAAFSFNHVPDPHAAFAEAARVTGPGGAVLASAYATDDSHPVKRAVEVAAIESGWSRPAWMAEVTEHAVPLLATVDGARRVAAAAGLVAEVEQVDVAFPELDAAALVRWRLGMAQVAPYVAGLAPDRRAQLERRALELLGPDPEPLVRRIIVLVART
ncbi:MAG: class I SAM-dependent methyltransferase [Acidimicrobiales bacterium]